jgi:hypothetical protein
MYLRIRDWLDSETVRTNLVVLWHLAAGVAGLLLLTCSAGIVITRYMIGDLSATNVLECLIAYQALAAFGCTLVLAFTGRNDLLDSRVVASALASAVVLIAVIPWLSQEADGAALAHVLLIWAACTLGSFGLRAGRRAWERAKPDAETPNPTVPTFAFEEPS